MTEEAERLRIRALAQALGAHGYPVEVAESEPVLCVAGASFLTVRCGRRASDAGTLWFFLEDGEPLAPADAAHLHEAITGVKGRL